MNWSEGVMVLKWLVVWGLAGWILRAGWWVIAAWIEGRGPRR